MLNLFQHLYFILHLSEVEKQTLKQVQDKLRDEAICPFSFPFEKGDRGMLEFSQVSCAVKTKACAGASNPVIRLPHDTA